MRRSEYSPELLLMDEEGEEGLIIDQEYLAPEEVASDGVVQKKIESKTKEFDVLMKIEPQDDSTYFSLPEAIDVTDQFDGSGGGQEMTPNSLKIEFQRGRIELFDDQIHSQFIFGWSDFTGLTYLVNPTQLGTVCDDLDPLSDTILPVMVMGPAFLPCAQEMLLRDMAAFGGGLYLVLEESPIIPEYLVQISVQAYTVRTGYMTFSFHRFEVNSYPARLNFYRNFFSNIPEIGGHQKFLSSLGSIDRIIDKGNRSLGICGMLAVGQLPAGQANFELGFRLAWDLPIETSTNGSPVEVKKGILCYHNDHKSSSQRIGYFLGQDAHLVVTELTGYELDLSTLSMSSQHCFRSLMNEGTFVVCDGHNSYKRNHDFGCDTVIDQFTSDSHSVDLSPRLVFIPEGINALNICLDKERKDFRNARYFNARATEVPIVVDWRQFQNHFDLTLKQSPKTEAPPQEQKLQESGPSAEFRQVMAGRDFSDYVIINLSTLSHYCSVLLLCQFREPEFIEGKNRHHQYWHVFALLRDNHSQPGDCLYYYLATMYNSYEPNKGLMQYHETHFLDPLFPPGIDRNKYPFLTGEELMAADDIDRNWRNNKGGVSANQEWKTFQPWLGNLRATHITRPGALTASRENSFNKILSQSTAQTKQEPQRQ